MQQDVFFVSGGSLSIVFCRFIVHDQCHVSVLHIVVYVGGFVNVILVVLAVIVFLIL